MSSFSVLCPIGLVFFLSLPCFAEGEISKAESIPPVVVELANSYASANKSTSETEKSVSSAFAGGFFSGYSRYANRKRTEFKSYKGPRSPIINAYAKGEIAGHQYRERNPGSVDKIMTGFDYRYVEYRGSWRTGFEASQFRPDAVGFKHSGIWLSPMHESLGKIEWTDTPLPDDYKESKYVSEKQLKSILGKTAKVKVKGYISPKGKHGHMGYFEFELFATMVEQNTSSTGTK